MLSKPSLQKPAAWITALNLFVRLPIVWPDGDEVCVEGKVKGQLMFPARGTMGFGYDPIFQPDGHKISFGEMNPDAKHAISHRADAFAQLLARCFGKADGR
jgi:XTP/dITP diphosphohydrolase